MEEKQRPGQMVLFLGAGRAQVKGGSVTTKGVKEKGKQKNKKKWGWKGNFKVFITMFIMSQSPRDRAPHTSNTSLPP